MVTTLNRGILWVTVDLGNSRVSAEVWPSPRVPITSVAMIPAGTVLSEWLGKVEIPAVVASVSDNGLCGCEFRGDVR